MHSSIHIDDSKNKKKTSKGKTKIAKSFRKTHGFQKCKNLLFWFKGYLFKNRSF